MLAMEKNCNCGPEEHAEFFKAIGEVFARFPEASANYSVRNKKQLEEIAAGCDAGMIAYSHVVDGKIVIEMVSKDAPEIANLGCCETCSKPNGDIYCCVTGC